MIAHPAFAVEPWALRESGVHLDVLAQTGSLFALANGHLGLRGNLDEAEPPGLPGTYLNGFYENRRLSTPERGWAHPEAAQAAVNITNGKIIRLVVDDEPFDVRTGALLDHERLLDFRAGTLRRSVHWRSPSGKRVRITSVRLVSLVQRAVAAILYEVEPLDAPARLTVQSVLLANEPMPHGAKGEGAEASRLRSEQFGQHDARVVLVHGTRDGRLRLAAAMDHVVEGPAGTDIATESSEDLGRVSIIADVKPGERLRVLKLLAYGWSSKRSTPALRAQVVGALAEARRTGWDGLLTGQRRYLDDFWERADVELEGDAELQQAVRFALFHTLQAGARAERRAIAAKGLTGTGHGGQAFWDTETYVLPVLTYVAPHAARDALRWRHATLDLARERAKLLGLDGAAFPWRTIDGRECSEYWPAGTAGFHIGADIADAVGRYQAAADDPEFERETGVELLVETARLWCSLGHHDAHGRFRIDGVTGPDEYGAIADNNVYTNLMAQRNLRLAANAVGGAPDRAAQLGVGTEEAAAWRDAANAMMIPFDEELGVHPQSEGYTEHQPWDFEHTDPGQYPLVRNFPSFDLYRKQVLKQADLVLAMHLCGDAFSDDVKARNFAYYEALTVRDSSLSACTQAVIAAELGHLELAYDYFAEAALIDIDNLDHDTRDGLHIASLAGTWIAAVAGFGGMRDHTGGLTFSPRLPERLTRLSFGMCFRERRLTVEIDHDEARYRLLEGPPLEIAHHGTVITVTTGDPVRCPIPPIVAGECPTQPWGRAPLRRGTRARHGAVV